MNDFENLLAIYQQLNIQSSDRTLTEKLEELLHSQDLEWPITKLGHELSRVLLVLLLINYSVSETLFNRLQRYQTESRLKDLSQALLFTVDSQLIINEELINGILNKTKKGNNFTPTVKLFFYARKLDFINETNQVFTRTSAIFERMKPEYSYFYQALEQQSLLHKDILVNMGNSSPPKPHQISSVLTLYQNVLAHNALETINIYRQRYNLDPLCKAYSPERLTTIFKDLESKSWLTQQVVIVFCLISSWSYSTFQTYLSHSYRKGISQETQESLLQNLLAIYDHKEKKLALETFFEWVNIISDSDCTQTHQELLTQFSALRIWVKRVKNSCVYLKEQQQLNTDIFLLITDFYQSERWNHLQQQKKKPRTTYSLNITHRGSFFEQNTKYPPEFEPAEIICALADSHIKHLAPAILAKIDVVFARFILELYYLGELTEARLLPIIAMDVISQDSLETYIQLARDHQELNTDLSEQANIPTLTESQSVDYQSKLTELKTTFNWSEEDIIQLGHVDNITAFICRVKRLNQMGLLFQPSHIECWLLELIKHGTTSISLERLLIALINYQLLTESLWRKLELLPSSEVNTINSILRRLDNHQLCQQCYLDYILQAKNKIILTEVIIQLKQENIHVETYLPFLIQHLIPLLLAKAILLLHAQRVLTLEYVERLLPSKRPDLAAKALLLLITAHMNIDTIWPTLIQVENPEEHVELLIQGKADNYVEEEQIFPPSIQQAIYQHTHPKQAQAFASILLSLNDLPNPLIPSIISSTVAESLVMVLQSLQARSLLSDTMCAFLVDNPDRIELVDTFYALTNPDNGLLAELQPYKNMKLAKQRLELAKYQQTFPQYSEQLLTIFNQKLSSGDSQNFIDALTQLSTKELIDQLALDALSIAKYSMAIANLIGYLYRDKLYNRNNMRLIINCHNEESIRAINTIAKKNTLNQMVLRFTTISKNYLTLLTLGQLATYPEIKVHHLNWLNTVFKELKNHEHEELIAHLFDTLIDTQILTLALLEQLMAHVSREEPSLNDIAFMLYYIPQHLLDNNIIQAILSSSGVCYDNDNDDYYNPFKKFNENDSSLLTKEVIYIILKQPEGNSYKVYYMMERLKSVGLFTSEIIADCTSQEIVDGYIKLHQQQQLTTEHRTLLKNSPHPDQLAQLILFLIDRKQYDSEIYQLLIEQERFQTSSYHSASKYKHYTCIIPDLIKKLPSLNKESLNMLLSHRIDWYSLREIINYLDKEAVTEDSLLLIISGDLNYLKLIIDYRYQAPKYTDITYTELIRFFQYESLFNQEPIRKHLQASVGWGAEKTYDRKKIESVFSQLWSLCEAGQIQEIISLFENTLISTEAGTKLSLSTNF